MNKLMLTLLLCLTSSGLMAQQHRPVIIRELYKPAGYSNVVTANVPALFVAVECLGISAGAEYERFLDRDGLLSVALSAYAFGGSKFTLGGIRTGDVDREISGAYAVPSLMLHPAGNSRRIDFSIGPALLLGSIHHKDRQVGVSYLNPEKNFDRTDNFTGLMGELNMEIHSTGAFVFSPHLGIGGLFTSGLDDGAVVQLGLKFGGRF